VPLMDLREGLTSRPLDKSDAGAVFEVMSAQELVATGKDQRGEGFARALLVDAFANACEHGATISELSTDSCTGALSLYENVGMVVTSNWIHRAYRLS
jgi:GNAT superfamily N-acetyltransferase